MSNLEDSGVKENQQKVDNPVTLLPQVNWGEPLEPDGEFVLPVGTVTLLLADVEGSTRRWEEDPSAMASARAELRDLASELIGRHNGVRPLDQGEGDSFLGAFARPSEAVTCAVEIQRQTPLPLRIGIHVGEVQRTTEGNYIGPALNRAARLRATGHGGQILLSQGAADLVADKLEKASLRDMGSHRLKDLSRPERIFQLIHPDLKNEFPPLRSLDNYRHNLPIHPTRFIGRQAEMQQIRQLLSESSMVTLSGTGGAGKTRLAVQVGGALVADFADGVFICDLARVTDPQGVMAAATTAVGFSVEAVGSLVQQLSQKRLLLILDNCEHVISSAAELAQSLLAGAPTVQILATSREPLKVEGETNFSVPSLSVPPENEKPGVEGLAPYAASELFLDRARRARSDFTLDDEETTVVGDICRRLDGIPLAIELAAARVRVMSVNEIARGLNERFKLLTGGARTAVPRHQTLTASVDWSYDLLTELERVVLRRLSVFIGDFTLEAAKDVCSGPDVLDIAPHQVVDLLSLLVEKSLVMMTVADGQGRYRMLETIRQYAHARLEESGEEDEVRLAHRDHFLKVAQQLSRMGEGPYGQKAFDDFVKDRQNFESAFRWTCAREDFDEAATFLSYCHELLSAIWSMEAEGWVTAVIPNIEKVQEPFRTDALYSSVPYLTFSGPPPAHLEPLVESCIEFHRKSGDDVRLGRALLALVWLRQGKGDLAELLDEAVEVTERSGDARAAFNAKAHSSFHLGLEAQDRKTRYFDDLVRYIHELDAPLVQLGVGWTLWTLLAEDPARAVAVNEPLAQREFSELSSLERHSLTLHPTALVYAGRNDEATTLAEKLIADRESVGDMGCLGGLHFANAAAAESVDDSKAALVHAKRSTEALSRAGMAQMPELFEAILKLGDGQLDEAARTRDKYTKDALDPISAWFWSVLSMPSWYLQGETEKAEDLAHKTVAEAGASWDLLGPSFDVLAAIEVADESYIEATRLLAGASAHRDRIGLRMTWRVLRDLRRETMATIKEKLSQEEFDKAWSEGSAMSLHQTVTYVQRRRGERKRPPTGWRSLTPAEQQVIDFLSQGLSNKEIADKLFVSIRTVTTHLTHIYSKLNISSRTELVAVAANRLGPRA